MRHSTAPHPKETPLTMAQRPPLGPNAARNLAIFAILTVIKTLALIVFSSVLATALTFLARLTFQALHARQVFDSARAEQLAIFAGNAQAKVDGLWAATFGLNPGVKTLLVVGLIAIGVRAAAEWALNYFAQRAASGAKSSIRARVVDRVLATGGIDTPEGTGATAVLISRGLDALDDYYTKTLTSLVSSAVVPVMLVVYVGLHDWVSALVLVLTLPLIPLFMVLIGKTTREDTAAAHRELLRLADHIVELVKGLPVLIGLGRARAQSQALGQLGERYRATTMKTLRSAFLSSFWLELITTISIAVIAVLIGVRLVNGQMGLDVALLALLLAPECYQPLRDVGAAYHQSEDGVASLHDAQRIIDTPEPASLVEPEGDSLRVTDLTVSYPGRGTVLDRLNFSVPAGSTTAIMGPSGCGKSTLLGALSGAVADSVVPTGYREPMRVSGSISGTGETVWVSQSPTFLASSVLNEVALYGFPAQVNHEKDLDAALNLISQTGPMSLSQRGREKYLGYLRIVGLENFADLAPESLSAGQMRRLGIARTLARVDALEKVGQRVTVLVDEPTAHLDAAAATRVHASLATLAATGATLLIVTHDPALAERTDYVLTAQTDAQGKATSWSQTTGGATGWDLNRLKEEVMEKPLDEQLLQTPRVGTNPQPVRYSVPQTLRYLGKLTGLKPRHALLPVLCSVLAATFAIALTALSGWLIVRAAEQPAMMYLLVAVTGVRFFGLGRAALRYLERLRTHDAVLRATNNLRLNAWNSAGRTVLSIRSLLRGDKILDRLVGDIDELRDRLPRVILPVASHLVVMILALVVTAFAAPRAIIPVAAGVLLSTFVIPALVRYTDHRADAIARESTSEMLRLGVGALDSARDLHANGLADLTATAFAHHDERNVESQLAGARATGFGNALTTVTWWAVALATIALNWTAVRHGELTAPSVAVVVLMCTALFETSAAHIQAVRGWPALAELVARMAPLVRTSEDAREEAPERAALHRAELAPPITLRLEDVATRWPGMKEPVFTGLNASVSSGTWLGITGPSGSGKTTALATLLGFLPAEQGHISVNGHRLSAEELRGYAAWCPQSSYIFESSIANNLAIAADAEHRPSAEQMMHVLDRVGLGDFVRSLPRGLDTPVGAGGSFVSGGQRQRIAIARTLLTESTLLLMDEPTAHLDAPAARDLIAEVARGTKSARGDGEQRPAVVLVSHRPEDIAACDDVVRLG